MSFNFRIFFTDQIKHKIPSYKNGLYGYSLFKRRQIQFVYSFVEVILKRIGKLIRFV